MCSRSWRRSPSNAAGREYAAFLLGAADGIREVIGAPVPEIEKPDHQATRAAIEESLDRRAFRTAWSAGRAAPLAAVADGYPPPGSASARTTAAGY